MPPSDEDQLHARKQNLHAGKKKKKRVGLRNRARYTLPYESVKAPSLFLRTGVAATPEALPAEFGRRRTNWRRMVRALGCGSRRRGGERRRRIWGINTQGFLRNDITRTRNKSRSTFLSLHSYTLARASRRCTPRTFIPLSYRKPRFDSEEDRSTLRA